jgi:hypothetical protein
MRRAIVSVMLAVVAVVGLGLGGVRPAGAEIQPSELTDSDVVVEPGASLSAGDHDRLVAAARDLRARGVPTKFVVAATRPADPPQAARDLRRGSGFTGNVLLLALSPTRSLGIASGLPKPLIDTAYNDSLTELRADPVGGMIAVANRLAQFSGEGSSLPPAATPVAPGADRTGGAEKSGVSVAAVLLIGLALVVGFLAFTRWSSRKRAEADLADRRAALEPLVDALAAHITELGSDLRLAGERAPQAQPYYDEAVLAYGEVRDAMPTAGTRPALDSIRQTLERGLRAAVSARAVLDGRPLPPPEETALLEGLCAFDPKHGRAVRDMPVVTPSGNEAPVPVCASCAEGLEQGRLPDVRRVYQRGRAVPYWQGAGSLGFGGGLFPMFGGMLGGMVLHDMLTPDVTVIDDRYDGNDVGHGDDGGFFGGGDIGGDGDWGGGDFGGGGDFDGGDFGGGGDF